MLSPALRAALEQHAREALGSDFRIESVEPVRGGDINTALKLVGPGAAAFVKLRGADGEAMFAAETAGLAALRACSAIRTPEVLAHGSIEDHSFLLLEWLDIQPIRSPKTARRAGEALSTLHRCTGAHFGWHHDNFLGSTLQANPVSDNWSRFFVQQRLLPQLERAARKGFGSDLQRDGERLCNRAPALFLEYAPQPSLLHGDLWSGNLGALPDGTPVLFDPACYYGDRDADLAMTELFGGLPMDFYVAYRSAWPLAEGYEQRKMLYNLYHVLNHLNLFGGGYLRQAERMACQLAAELGR